MAIKIKVSNLMGIHKVNKKQVSEGTGIRPTTVASYYDETIKRISVEHLEAFRKFFKLKSMIELMEFIPDEEEG